MKWEFIDENGVKQSECDIFANLRFGSTIIATVLDMPLAIYIKTLTGKTVSLGKDRIPNMNITVGHLKSLIQDVEGIPPD